MSNLLNNLIPAGRRSCVASSSMLCLVPASSRAMGSLSPTPRLSQPAKRIDEIDHIPTTPLGKTLLTTGSALGLLNNPARGDLLSMLTQVSSPPSMSHLLQSMRSTESGRRLLIERPSINSETVDVAYLGSLDRGTFGREWIEWLKENGVGPDGRAEADYMKTAEEKYLIQRYRESHDFYHLLLRMPVTQLGETTVKYFEMAQMSMPVAGFAAAGGTLRILGSVLSSLPKPSALLSAVFNRSAPISSTLIASTSSSSMSDLASLQTLVPWAVEVGRTSVPLISIEWERCWERNIDEMRNEFGITPPPIQIAKFQGRKKSRKGAKLRGWPSKVMEAAGK